MNDDKRRNAAKMLAKGMTQADITRELGMTDRSFRKWQRDLSFRRLVKEAQVEIDVARRAALTEVKLGSHPNIDSLIKIIEDEEKPVAVRLRAIATLFGMMGQIDDLLELREMIEMLETKLADIIGENRDKPIGKSQDLKS